MERGTRARSSHAHSGDPTARRTARRTSKELTYTDTRTSREQRVKHAQNPLHLLARSPRPWLPAQVSGVGPGQPMFRSRLPARLGPQLPPRCPVRWRSATSSPLVSGETESAQQGRGGHYNPSAAGSAHARCACPAPASGPPIRIPGIPDPSPSAWCPKGLRGRGALPRATGSTESSLAWFPAPQKYTRIPGGPDRSGGRFSEVRHPRVGRALWGGYLRPPFPVRAGIPRPRREALGKGLAEKKWGKALCKRSRCRRQPSGNHFHLWQEEIPETAWLHLWYTRLLPSGFPFFFFLRT